LEERREKKKYFFLYIRIEGKRVIVE